MRAVAGGLRELGVRPGDRISALAMNSDRFLLHYQAAWWLGAIPAPFNTRWSISEMIYSLRDVGATVLLVDSAYSDRVDAITAACPDVRHVITLDDADLTNGIRVGDLVAHGIPIDDAGHSGQDRDCILFTGGTTGFPKGALLSHDNVVTGGVGMRAMGCDTSQRLLHAAPLFHMGGVQMASGHWFGNGTHVLVPGFVPSTVADTIERR